ncbi:unnamed protein product [Chrysodeixis includens]|uniref:Uncharacterized protein n=1 Tax=Chrysodeixis includens TaxID=689277 RepID=A0A9N8L3J4_CHRIL|nr:unnamed protein product [Chrysodeixis includens]
MLTIAPCTAYRLLKDFRYMQNGDTVIQNAANSPCGQCIIQLCRNMGLKTLNIVANHCGYEAVKKYLLNLGGSAVFTLEEAEELSGLGRSLTKPVLALNCLGGRYEDVMLKLLDKKGVIVYYGCAYDLPMVKQFLRKDARFYKFSLNEWEACATCVDKDIMYKELIQQMVVGHLAAPVHHPLELKDYVYALKNTVQCEAFATLNYVFDFTLP